MNISDVKRTMREKNIPPETIDRFVYPETEAGTIDEKINFAGQMDALLDKSRILSVMEEQGCEKYPHDSDSGLMKKMTGKTVEERVAILNTYEMYEQPHCKINDDGTLGVFIWFKGDDGRYYCVCPDMEGRRDAPPVSLTYCGCCGGHLKYHLQNSLGVSLKLKKIVSSPLNSCGGKYCEFLFEMTPNE